MTSIKIYAILGVIMLFLAGFLIKSLKDNGKLEFALETAASTIQWQTDDAIAKEKINKDSKIRLEELESETNQLREDLDGQETTEIQRDCDVVVSPAGYANRMLEYAGSQTRSFETR